MSKNFEYIIDVFAAVIIIFLFPLIFFGLKQDSLVQTLVSAETESLVNDIRSKGYLTKDMYDFYQQDLAKTGLLYDTTLKHKQVVYEPEYRFRTEAEVIDGQNTAYTGSNNYTYTDVTTNIPTVTDPVSIGTTNTETNASVLASAVNTPASSSHIHNTACYYNGTLHTHTGNSTSGGGCYGTYTAHQHSSSCYTTGYCDGVWTGGWPTEYIAYQVCSFCGVDSKGWGTYTTASGIPAPLEWTCLSCWKMNSTAYQFNKVVGDWQGHCTKCTYGIAASMSMEGITHGTYSTLDCSLTRSYTLNCGKTAGAYYNGINEVFPSCSQQIASIMATHPTQTVYQNDALITTVVVTHLDGSTETVIGTTTFSTANIVQNASATIKYSVIVGGVSITKTCNITITVIPKTKICSNGHTYNLYSDASDPGCPYCRAWLSSLAITYPATGSITIYKGTTLSSAGVTLLATYMDGHTQVLYNEYVDNLDTDYVGVQDVTISYKGKYVHLTVITKRVLKLCPVCNRYYELYPDLSDPGCPYCVARTPVFTGNIMQYYNEYYSDEILAKLYEGSGVYYFSDKDYIAFSVSNSRKSWGRRLLEVFLRGFGDNGIQTVYGGYVREDGNSE